ncbi:MAG: plasmid recombination protein [Firmicutes bacterium]|nr:plasmid recombination protein [Bacillota bacterium]
MEKTDRTVVRNQPYQRGGIGIRERHNERKNECYSNPDIELARSHLNVHFRRCEGTYKRALDRMLEQGIVSTRGLKPDAKVFEEMVFDVNTAYFERHGGYDFAQEFFREVFRFAEQEVGSEYILSAVMHADERNRALSDELGRDVYHYHLHVIYLPVVEKHVKWSKRCRDPSLVGTTKEIIHQISHSKKWAFPVEVGADGTAKRVTSYGLLQTRFFEHMRQAGYDDLERGVEGSTAEHLDVVEYKVEQERQRLSTLTEQAEEKVAELTEVEQKIEKVQPVPAQISEINVIGRKKRFGEDYELTAGELDKLKKLAKYGITAQSTIADLERQLTRTSNLYWREKEAFDKLYTETQPFRDAMRLAPQRMRETIRDIFQQAKEAKEQRKARQQSRYR